jgi:predicted nucleotidyltransferase
MDAEPFLTEIARHLNELHFDVVLIGNAAAALQGAPVTTIDFDFMFRKTSVNLRKLKALAARLGATVLRPYYPVSDLFRVVRDDDGLQLDFMGTIHGVRSFAGLRERARTIELGGVPLLVASLDDIIRSKRAARRPRDLAVIETLERTRETIGQTSQSARRPQARKRSRAR